jgi:hypothetical protein
MSESTSRQLSTASGRNVVLRDVVGIRCTTAGTPWVEDTSTLDTSSILKGHERNALKTTRQFTDDILARMSPSGMNGIVSAGLDGFTSNFARLKLFTAEQCGSELVVLFLLSSESDMSLWSGEGCPFDGELSDGRKMVLVHQDDLLSNNASRKVKNLVRVLDNIQAGKRDPTGAVRACVH